MSTSVTSTQPTRVQKVCTLWTHDENFSKEEVVFNAEKFPELSLSSGSLIQIIALKHATAVRDFQTTAKNDPKDSGQPKADVSARDAYPDTYSRRTRRGSVLITLDENGVVVEEGREVDYEKSYIFVAKPLTADLKSKHSQLQVGP